MAKKLTIGVDIRDLQLAKTGTKTYLEELCAAFKEMDNVNYQFHFIDTRIPVWTGSGKFAKYVEHFRYQWWKQVMLPLKAWSKNVDILFCTDNFVPLIRLGYQTVPVFHDAFFFENPEHYGKLWLSLYHQTAVPAAKKAAFIVTPTHYAQEQIHKHTGIPLAQLKVVYEGPKKLIADIAPANRESNVSSSTTSKTPAILNQWKLDPGRYLLHVGSMFKRKNVPALIRAFKKLKSDTQSNGDLKLVLAGPSTSSKDSNDFQLILEAIAGAKLQEEVILTGYLTDVELAILYTHALAYVFPSVNEGFGIPILEAFQYHLPVLVANNTCLPEVGGDAVLQFDPFDENDIAKKMNLVVENEELRQSLIKKGNIRLKDFSWQKTAAQLLDLFSAHY